MSIRIYLSFMLTLILTACGTTDSTIDGSTEAPPTDIIHNGLTYSTVTSPFTGRIWLDRNIGALRACVALNDTACYGDFIQWGRGLDGHELENSALTSTQAVDINNAGTSFIVSLVAPYDWVAVLIDDTLVNRSFNWSKTDGSSVCPVGYRVPTGVEIAIETTSASTPVENNIDAFNNFLKLPSAGHRTTTGTVELVGEAGSVWAGDTYYYTWNQGGYDSPLLLYYSDRAGTTPHLNTTYGRKVRCIKDY